MDSLHIQTLINRITVTKILKLGNNILLDFTERKILDAYFQNKIKIQTIGDRPVWDFSNIK